MRGLIAGALALVGLVACGAARAACQVDGRSVDFGTIDPSEENEGVGEVIVRCDGAIGVEVSLSRERAMQGPGNAELRYGLFQDSGHNRAWGDGGASGETQTDTTDEEGDLSMTVYGLIPPQPGTSPGDYVDQVQITVIF